jgi:UPF0176 protein
MNYQVLLYYKFVEVIDPEAERDWMLDLCQRLELKGRILIACEGLNGTVSGTRQACAEYMATLNKHPLFQGIEYKIDDVDVAPFPKLRVRARDEIVTLEAPVDMANTAPHITPAELNEMLKDPSVIMFDGRNNYESAIGRFKGAITPDVSLFKDLPDALNQYEDLKEKTIVTYCTGGIRCEKASALMKQKGFKNVYQLDGGIVNYGKQFPDGAWEGDLYVFDKRIKVSFNENSEQLGDCIACEVKTNDYYNCAYHPCNKMMLVCTNCAAETRYCSEECAELLVK